MFGGCYNLKNGPEDIPYANGEDTFKDMFSGCFALKSAGVKWTTWPYYSGSLATSGWLADTTAGTFKCPAALTIPERSDGGVPESWTIQHT